MPPSQKLLETYKSLSQNPQNLLPQTSLKQALTLLNLYSPQSQTFQAIEQRYSMRKNEKGQKIEFITLEQFEEIVWLMTSWIQQDFMEIGRKVGKLGDIGSYVREKGIVVMDRGIQGKVVVRIGQQQHYPNAITLQLQKLKPQHKNSHIRLQFTQKKPSDKPKLQKKLAELVNKLKQNFKDLIQQLGESDSVYESTMKFLNLSIRPTQKGAEIYIELKSAEMDRMIQTLADCINAMFNCDPMDILGKINLAFKFSEPLKYLLNKSQPYTIFDILSKNCQLSLSTQFGQILTAIKQLIVQSREFSQLKYQKFHLPGLLAIALSNTEQLEVILQLKCIQFTQEQRQELQEYVKIINALLIELKKKLNISKKIGNFMDEELFGIMGDQVNLCVDLGYFVGKVGIRVEGLGMLVKKVFQFMAEAAEEEGEEKEY